MTVQVAEATDALRRARRENETLYAVIKTVSSSLDLDRVLNGIVEIATDATGCHACFIYFLEGDRLALRAASPRYSRFVGKVGLGVDEGLAGAVARTKTPEFIRENALADPRMKYVPELEEERFQSMVAVPILAKGERRDRGRRAAHRGAARVRPRRAQLPRPHGVAGRRGDRERPAVRRDQDACAGADDARRSSARRSPPSACRRTCTTPSHGGHASCSAPTRARSTASTLRRTS